MSLDPKYKAVCFDMDGTFMNSHVDYLGLFEVVYSEMLAIGVPDTVIDKSQGSKFNLDGGINWLKENGRESELYAIQDRIADRSRDIEMANANMARPYPGAMNLLQLLHKEGYKTGILTRGCREYSEYILGMCGALEHFDTLVARDDYPEEEAKPSPQAIRNLAKKLDVLPEEILFLGDHKFDYQTAHDAGAGFIGVLCGSYAKEDWKNVSEDIEYINTVYDLLSMI